MAEWLSQLNEQVSSLNVAKTAEPIKQEIEKAEPVVDAYNPEETSLLTKLLRDKLVKSSGDVELEDQRSNPMSPLHSVKTFEELNLKPELLRGVYDMGFNKPSKIQETALPLLINDPPQNLIAQSQSGTGKTAAFVLTMLSRVNTTLNYPQVICLSPTYELAQQTGKVVQAMGKYISNLKIRYAVKGERIQRSEQLSEHIIIGTPGTMLDWALKFRAFNMSLIKVFVLDEADVMIAQQGHKDQSIRLHKGLDKKTCQMLFFSATYNAEVMSFAGRIVDNPIIIKLRREEETLDSIKQYYIQCANAEAKISALWSLYAGITVGQAIIFCHTRRFSAIIASKMQKEGFSVELLNGDLDVSQRAAVLERFRNGDGRVLITTNVCARGIDIDNVTLVINFDLPVDTSNQPDYETYLHRIGRTGRFGSKGLAINMVEPQYIPLLHKISDHFKKPIHQLTESDLENFS